MIKFVIKRMFALTVIMLILFNVSIYLATKYVTDTDKATFVIALVFMGCLLVSLVYGVYLIVVASKKFY